MDRKSFFLDPVKQAWFSVIAGAMALLIAIAVSLSNDLWWAWLSVVIVAVTEAWFIYSLFKVRRSAE